MSGELANDENFSFPEEYKLKILVKLGTYNCDKI